MKTIITLLICLFTVQLFASNIQVDGVVQDSNGLPLQGVNIIVKGTAISTQTDFHGKFKISVVKEQVLVFTYVGFKNFEIEILDERKLTIEMIEDPTAFNEVVVTAQGVKKGSKALGYAVSEVNVARTLSGKASGVQISGSAGNATHVIIRGYNSIHGTPISDTSNESYARIEENIFKRVSTAPLSTFSIDVDKAAYSNMRRLINNGQQVPQDAVKIEEMVNYFAYDYPEPKHNEPFSIITEVAPSPWNQNTQLVRIGLKGRDISVKNTPASNLVFLIDVSGSMNTVNKLGLLKSAFEVLVNQLRETDKVSIVVYAGAAGMVLPPTSGNNKDAILKAINDLSAGGSTAGGAGIELAYKIAEEQFISEGNNRVVLATDGDFNVGASSNRAMEDLIEDKRKSGVFLTVLGFGMGNYQDDKMELLADKGNGNHAYIDTLQEAKKVLGTEFFGTMYTIAKDVKLQVEFNPAKVKGYRLIGYENRLLNDEDFNDDAKDAGELGSGHTVTALYEIIRAGIKSEYLKEIDGLKYTALSPKGTSNELLTVKFRYKDPSSSQSKLIEKKLTDYTVSLNSVSPDFKFASAVALFGQQLRDSEYIKANDMATVISLAEAGRGKDLEGYRAEFIRLVKSYQHLKL